MNNIVICRLIEQHTKLCEKLDLATESEKKDIYRQGEELKRKLYSERKQIITSATKQMDTNLTH